MPEEYKQGGKTEAKTVLLGGTSEKDHVLILQPESNIHLRQRLQKLLTEANLALLMLATEEEKHIKKKFGVTYKEDLL